MLVTPLEVPINGWRQMEGTETPASITGVEEPKGNRHSNFHSEMKADVKTVEVYQQGRRKQDD